VCRSDCTANGAEGIGDLNLVYAKTSSTSPKTVTFDSQDYCNKLICADTSKIDYGNFFSRFCFDPLDYTVQPSGPSSLAYTSSINDAARTVAFDQVDG
jgi:hypothetical protein